MSSLSQLQPQPLWQWFEQICAIPHPSKHEAALSQYIQNWAKDRQLEVIEDKVGNLIIRKDATPGMENRKPVVIQPISIWCRRKMPIKSMTSSKIRSSLD